MTSTLCLNKLMVIAEGKNVRDKDKCGMIMYIKMHWASGAADACIVTTPMDLGSRLLPPKEKEVGKTE
jgi:hypothetical protein